MKLFKESGYVRLDDDVSFQLVRTNPKLTTNTKLMYDGENLYMESYDAAPLLSTIKYKHHRVWKTGLFNKDIRNFLLGTNTAAYEVGQAVADTVVMDNFDNQFENMYWCGVESINSDMYPQEMGCVAPLYIRKKLPNYFVIFRLDKPTNTVTSKDDTSYVFDDDIKKQMQIVKTFNLQEGTPIGNYIKKYVEQKDFKYDQSIYVNFSSNEIYYYGIDKKSGVLTQKVENFEEPLLKNDNTIIKMDDWITEGFERNNLIFPYIINLEFLFDDKSTEEYRFARYFGMYCNDIDLFDLEVSDCIYNSEARFTTITTTQNENIIDLNGDHICYIKDKYDGIHSIKNTYIPGFYSSLEKLDKDIFTGFEIGSTSTYAERLPNTGKAFIMFQITGLFGDGDTVKMYDPKADAEDVSQFGGKFIATTQLDAGESYDNRFSCKGTTIDTAKALAAAIRTCDSDNFKWITAFNIDDKVVIQSIFPGTYMNGLFKISFNGNIKHLTGGEFKGGTNYNGCIFKVYTSDEDIFFDNTETDRDTSRYLQTYSGNGKEPAQIVSFMPYITDDKKVDKTYSIIITDDNGKYAVVSKTEQISIIDKFYPKIGVLSFFPVRDFDFDTMSSVYGDSSLIRDEIDELYIYVGEDSEPDEENPEITGQILSQVIKPYRFYDSIGNDIDTEYDYYVENLIPELTTVNKTTPFIAKWGYMDDAKDSCENPYRLNTSKIFETCNFSANTFMQRGDITEYTHSMPYYIKKTFSSKENKDNLINEYQYIPMDNCQAWSQSFSELKKYFENKTEDRFAAIFGDNSTTRYANKRFNKKYSRFLTGDSVNKASTLFRGVKFEISEIVNEKEVNTGKYNDYRFTMVYVPVDKKSDKVNDKKVHFIKNDKFKFIVGVIYCNIWDDITEREFNKAYVYSGCEGFVAFPEDYITEENSGGGSSSGGNSGSGSGSGGGNTSGGDTTVPPNTNGEYSSGGVTVTLNTTKCHVINEVVVMNTAPENYSSCTINVSAPDTAQWSVSSTTFNPALISVDTESGTYTGNKQITVTPLVNNGNQTGRVTITPNTGTPIEYRFYPLHHEEGISRFIYPISQGVGQYFNVGQTVQLYIKFPYVLIGNSTPTLTFKSINYLDKDSVDVTFVSKGRTPDDAYTFVYNLKGKAVAPIRDGYGDATMTFTYTLNGETKDLEFYYRVKGNSTSSGDDSGSSSGGSSSSGSLSTSISGQNIQLINDDKLLFMNCGDNDNNNITFRIDITAPNTLGWKVSGYTSDIMSFRKDNGEYYGTDFPYGTGSGHLNVKSKNYTDVSKYITKKLGIVESNNTSNGIIYIICYMAMYPVVFQYPNAEINPNVTQIDSNIDSKSLYVGDTVKLYIKFPKNLINAPGVYRSVYDNVVLTPGDVPNSINLRYVSGPVITSDGACTFVYEVTGRQATTSGTVTFTYDTINYGHQEISYIYKVLNRE